MESDRMRCPRCDTDKAPIEFGANRSTTTGKASACLICERERDQLRDPVRDQQPHRQAQNREKGRRRRAREANVYLDRHTEAQMVEHWHERGIDPVMCTYCGEYADTVDHIIALALGGPHVLDNTTPACKHCNSSKGSKPISAWLEHLMEAVH